MPRCRSGSHPDRSDRDAKGDAPSSNPRVPGIRAVTVFLKDQILLADPVHPLIHERSKGKSGREDQDSYRSLDASPQQRSVPSEDSIGADLKGIAPSAPVKELLDPETDEPVKHLLIASIAQAIGHYRIFSFSLLFYNGEMMLV